MSKQTKKITIMHWLHPESYIYIVKQQNQLEQLKSQLFRTTTNQIANQKRKTSFFLENGAHCMSRWKKNDCEKTTALIRKTKELAEVAKLSRNQRT